MSVFLSIRVRFLDPRFHGRSDGGEPEWPPSPLRVFQALVSAAAARHRGHPMPENVTSAFRWLERLSQETPPRIVAPSALEGGAGYRLSVPNNALDLVGKAWSRGNYSLMGDANPARHRTMKTVQPRRFRDEALHFCWPLPQPPTPSDLAHVEVLSGISRHLVALGWGVDLVCGSGAVVGTDELEALPGEHWCPGLRRTRLRVPVEGTFEALEDRHHHFLSRLVGNAFTAPPPMTRFRVVGYGRQEDLPLRAVAAFALRDPSHPDRYRPFDPVQDGARTAGRMRHAAHEAARDAKADEWSAAEIRGFVLGHGEEQGSPHVPVGPRRFAYLPVPTIESRAPSSERVGAVRRVLVTTFAAGCDAEVAWAERALAGRELVDEATKQPVAVIEAIPEGDRVVARYLVPAGAVAWATVTPVVLPGHDDPNHHRKRLERGASAEEQRSLIDRLEKRVDGLLRKAIVQAGFPEALARMALLCWRPVGFWPGTELARRYRVPKHLERLPRVHVRLEWRDTGGRPLKVAGPVCIGGGRFYGQGLFAAL